MSVTQSVLGSGILWALGSPLSEGGHRLWLNVQDTHSVNGTSSEVGVSSDLFLRLGLA